MSLLAACRQALPKQSQNTILRAASRSITDNAQARTDALTPTEDVQKDTAIVSPEPRDVLTADVISGAPRQLRHRAVRIYQPARNTMQSGSNKTNQWRIDFDILQGGGRWENPLMGWASSADYVQGVRMPFRSKEDAIHFAEKQGWDYYVQTPAVKRIPPKNYSENYLYKPNTLRIMRTK